VSNKGKLVGVLLQNEELEKFERIKKHLGVANSSEVLRILINQYYKKIKGVSED